MQRKNGFEKKVGFYYQKMIDIGGTADQPTGIMVTVWHGEAATPHTDVDFPTEEFTISEIEASQKKLYSLKTNISPSAAMQLEANEEALHILRDPKAIKLFKEKYANDIRQPVKPVKVHNVAGSKTKPFVV